MEMIFCVLIGIFVGITSAGYMFIRPLADRDRTIKEQKEENLQVCDENKDLRAENEDLREDLFIANKKIGVKEKILQMFMAEITRNDYDRPDLHLKRLKELAKDYQSIN